MKKILIIGNTCADIVIRVPHLPVTAEDIQPSSQFFSLGGCPFNAANIIRQSGVPFYFSTPTGTGIYGDFVRKELQKRCFPLTVPVEEENGCCYCLVEDGGERTFLSLHGVEYLFRREWMRNVRMEEFAMCYVCGLEVEESTGGELVSWLRESPGPELFFAPGPRLMSIPSGRLDALLALHPVLHLNRDEAFRLSGTSDCRQAAFSIRGITGNTVIITLGADGACCLVPGAGELITVPAVKAEICDTIGAGDSHIGQVMASRALGRSWEEALRDANLTAAQVVSVPGATLSDEQYRRIPF